MSFISLLTDVINNRIVGNTFKQVVPAASFTLKRICEIVLKKAFPKFGNFLLMTCKNA